MNTMKVALILYMIFATGFSDDIKLYKAPIINSNAVIRQIFEMLKHLFIKGNIEKNIPILDPFDFKSKSFEILLPDQKSRPVLSLRGGFQNGTIKGFANFHIEEVEFLKKDVAVDLLVSFPFIQFKSEHYKVKGDIYRAIPLEGEGKFDMEIHKLVFRGRIYLKQSSNEKSILIHNITSSQFNLQQIVSRTNYDKNIDDILNTMINDLLATYANRFNHYISHKCAGDLIELLNLLLNKLDSWYMLTSIL